VAAAERGLIVPCLCETCGHRLDTDDPKRDHCFWTDLRIVDDLSETERDADDGTGGRSKRRRTRKVTAFIPQCSGAIANGPDACTCPALENEVMRLEAELRRTRRRAAEAEAVVEKMREGMARVRVRLAEWQRARGGHPLGGPRVPLAPRLPRPTPEREDDRG
jgi:hypothetical protein